MIPKRQSFISCRVGYHKITDNHILAEVGPIIPQGCAEEYINKAYFKMQWNNNIVKIGGIRHVRGNDLTIRTVFNFSEQKGRKHRIFSI